MKRILIGTAITLIGLMPALAVADCGPDHAAMASSATAGKASVAQASETTKAPATAATKVAAKQVKPVVARKTAPPSSKPDAVVAKTN
jgi:tRNA A22 N-methylase